ncbi:MAG TPA: chemotaxis protein CheW [Acidobacteriota bacterium]|nr:chemotaxis protein CheW [Acidobacteriota bacterium]
MPLPDVRPEEPDESQLHFVVFQVATQNFAVQIGRVKEVLTYRTVTPLPEGPSFIEGVIESRGRLIPVVDLAKRLGAVCAADNGRRHILVLGVGKQMIAIIVDSVQRVLSVPTANVDPPPLMGHTGGTAFVLAVARSENQMYVVLDIEGLLATTQKITPDQLALS